MKRKLIIINLFLLSIGVLPTSAVRFYLGFMGGYDYNHYSIETNYAYDMRYNGRGGLTIGLPTQLNVTDWFALRMDLMYVQKNHKMNRTHQYAKIYTNTSNHYLHLPIMLNFSFGGEKVRGYMSAGGYAGCWLASTREGQTLAVSNSKEPIFYAFDESRKIDNARERRFDSGLAGNVGIVFYIEQSIAFHVEAGCYYSLLSTEKDKNLISPNPRYNTTFDVKFGMTFAVGKKKNK